MDIAYLKVMKRVVDVFDATVVTSEWASRKLIYCWRWTHTPSASKCGQWAVELDGDMIPWCARCKKKARRGRARRPGPVSSIGLENHVQLMDDRV